MYLSIRIPRCLCRKRFYQIKIDMKHYLEVQHDIIKQFQKKLCLYPHCQNKNKDIIKAHTIQKSQSLKSISESGHVLQFDQTYNGIKDFVLYGSCQPKKVGINKATTFYGFCKKHDKSLFSAIEDDEIIPTEEQVFLFTFRTLAREYYTKSAAVNASPVFENIAQERPEIRHFLNIQNAGLNAGLKKLEKIYLSFSENLMKRNYSILNHLFIKINQIPDIMCGGLLYPDHDFDRNLIQDLTDVDILEWVSFTIFSQYGIGYILFSWEYESTIVLNFITNLLTHSNIINRIVGFAFEYTENIVFSPQWWNKLSPAKQKDLCFRAYDNYHYDFYSEN